MHNGSASVQLVPQTTYLGLCSRTPLGHFCSLDLLMGL